MAKSAYSTSKVFLYFANVIFKEKNDDDVDLFTICGDFLLVFAAAKLASC